MRILNQKFNHKPHQPRELDAISDEKLVFFVWLVVIKSLKYTHMGIVPHTVKPDKDNLEKAAMDALTGIQIWKDDCQVYGGNTEKYWTSGKSGAKIWIEAEEE